MATYQFTGNLTAGSPTVTNVTVPSGLAVGQVVAGAGLPVGAISIIAIGATTITLSANAISTQVADALVAQDANNLSNLELALQNAILTLALITAFPRPSYSIDGQSVSWEGYYNMILRSVRELREQIQVEGGPFAYRTQLWS